MSKAKANQLKLTLIKSRFGRHPKHCGTIASLGLKKINSSRVFDDNACLRGKIKQIGYLLKVEELSS